MTTTQHDLGYQAMAETITGSGDIFAKLNEFSSVDGTNSGLFAGAVSCVLTAYVGLREKGISIVSEHVATNHFLTGEPATMAITLNRWFDGGNSDGIRKALGAMADVVNQCRAMIGFKSLGAMPTPAPAQPLEVRVVNLPTPSTEPTPVQVVAMPARITTSTVERDNSGHITSTTQLEQDVAA